METVPALGREAEALVASLEAIRRRIHRLRTSGGHIAQLTRARARGLEALARARRKARDLEATSARWARTWNEEGSLESDWWAASAEAVLDSLREHIQAFELWFRSATEPRLTYGCDSELYQRRELEALAGEARRIARDYQMT